MVSFDYGSEEDFDYDALNSPLAELNAALVELLKTQIAVVIDDTSITTEEKTDIIARLFLDVIK